MTDKRRASTMADKGLGRKLGFHLQSKGAKNDPNHLRRRLSIGSHRRGGAAVSFSAPLVTSVWFIPPADPAVDFELRGLAKEIKRYRKRADIEAGMRSKSRPVRERARMLEEEMKLSRRRPRRERLAAPMDTSNRKELREKRVTFAVPVSCVRIFPDLGADARKDLFYTNGEINRFRSSAVQEARTNDGEYSSFQNTLQLAKVDVRTAQWARSLGSWRRKSSQQVWDTPDPRLARMRPSLAEGGSNERQLHGFDEPEIHFGKATRNTGDTDLNTVKVIEHKRALSQHSFLQSYSKSMDSPADVLVEV